MLGPYDFKTRALTRFDEISFFSLSLDGEKKNYCCVIMSPQGNCLTMKKLIALRMAYQ